MDAMNVRLMAERFSDPSGEIMMEVVAIGAGVCPALTELCSAQTSSGIFPAASPYFDCKGKAVGLLKGLFTPVPGGDYSEGSKDRGFSSMSVVLFNESEEEIGYLYGMDADASWTGYEENGKNVASPITFDNTAYGASSFRVKVLSVTGELSLYAASF